MASRDIDITQTEVHPLAGAGHGGEASRLPGVPVLRLQGLARRQPGGDQGGHMTGDALGAAIAAEEHRQGMRYGDDPGHCGQCAQAERQRLLAKIEANCRHERMIQIPEVGNPLIPGICADCGHQVQDVRVEER